MSQWHYIATFSLYSSLYFRYVTMLPILLPFKFSHFFATSIGIIIFSHLSSYLETVSIFFVANYVGYCASILCHIILPWWIYWDEVHVVWCFLFYTEMLWPVILPPYSLYYFPLITFKDLAGAVGI